MRGDTRLVSVDVCGRQFTPPFSPQFFTCVSNTGSHPVPLRSPSSAKKEKRGRVGSGDSNKARAGAPEQAGSQRSDSRGIREESLTLDSGSYCVRLQILDRLADRRHSLSIPRFARKVSSQAQPLEVRRRRRSRRSPRNPGVEADVGRRHTKSGRA